VGKYLRRLRNTKTLDECKAYHRVVLDESERKFSDLGAEVDCTRCVALPLLDDLPLEFGKILRYASDQMRQVDLT
jgi:hypothetical protein